MAGAMEVTYLLTGRPWHQRLAMHDSAPVLQGQRCIVDNRHLTATDSTTFDRMAGSSLAGRIWNASPLRLIGPSGQGDLSIRPSAVIRGVSSRIREMFEKDPKVITLTVPYSVVCIYRLRNSEIIEEMGLPRGSTRLWAIDEAAEDLANITYGIGFGNRFELLNRLLTLRPLTGEWLVVLDDDVKFTQGSIDAAVGLAAAAQIDLCSVSHSRWSYLNFGCTQHQNRSVARLTRFVEQGPCLILSPKAQPAILPFPEDIGMGWGIEAQWAQHSDLRLGILDAVHLRHLRPVMKSRYNVKAEHDRSTALLARSGFSTWSSMQRTEATWWTGEDHPSWLDA